MFVVWIGRYIWSGHASACLFTYLCLKKQALTNKMKPSCSFNEKLIQHSKTSIFSRLVLLNFWFCRWTFTEHLSSYGPQLLHSWVFRWKVKPYLNLPQAKEKHVWLVLDWAIFNQNVFVTALHTYVLSKTYL